jgi:sugar phosphate isomerase/epimerase
MKLADSHLCYSLNVFPAEHDVQTRIGHIGDKFNYIRKLLDLGKDVPFALGFWADAVFVEQMADTKNFEIVKKLLEDNNFYVFTINAFPYGQFHSTRVKEKVYQPDWTTEKRTTFTCNAADFLAKLLPENTPGSISTLPGGYKSSLCNSTGQDNYKRIAENLLKVAEHLAILDKEFGTEIVLGIEMEPDCLWESPAEFIKFYQQFLAKEAVAKKYIGVCYDTAHQELTGSSPGSGLEMLLQHEIKIAKIQLSTALKTENTTSSDFDSLQPFADEVYLHQTRLLNSNGKIIEKFSDIPGKISDTATNGGHLVSHFHLPLFCSNLPGDISVANKELLAVLKQLQISPEICRNIEIETYTYSVLPELINHREIEENIAKEYKWVLDLWD